MVIENFVGKRNQFIVCVRRFLASKDSRIGAMCEYLDALATVAVRECAEVYLSQSQEG